MNGYGYIPLQEQERGGISKGFDTFLPGSMKYSLQSSCFSIGELYKGLEFIFFQKWLYIALFLPSQRYEPQLFPTVFRCIFQKKNGIARKLCFVEKMADGQFWHDHAWPLPTVSDCFQLFPAVSVSSEGQFHLWNTDATKNTTFNTFSRDPSARRLLEMMQFDFEIQYIPKKRKSQDLLKFNDTI